MGFLGESVSTGLGEHLTVLPNPHSLVQPAPSGCDIPLGTVHLLRRHPPPIHPTKPDFPVIQPTAPEQHHLPQPNPCGDPPPTFPPSPDRILLPGKRPKNSKSSGPIQCGPSSNGEENPKSVQRLSRVLQTARVRGVTTPSEVKPRKPGLRTGRVQTRGSAPTNGDCIGLVEGGTESSTTNSKEVINEDSNVEL